MWTIEDTLKSILVKLSQHSYPIMIGEGLLSKAGRLLSQQGFSSAPIVITNNRVRGLHGAALMRSLEREFGKSHLIKIGDGERFKSHETLLKIYASMFRANANRKSWILAFGGGVVGDIAGFAAATFMRGIPFAMAPTTLLSQVDSSIGGKVGINAPQGKNLIGAFHQPSAVITDIDTLKTLPKRQLVSGLYEVIKSAAIRSESLLSYIERRLSHILNCRSGEMAHIVRGASEIKADVVALDEKEGGLRMILNYGHTIGHAFETATDYRRFTHGEAVAWGMIAALKFGEELGLMSPRETSRLEELILSAGNLPSIKGIHFDRLWTALNKDKKFQSKDIRMIFLVGLGRAEMIPGIDPSSLKRFLKSFLASY
jgi:3-dehydroquinate synthase